MLSARYLSKLPGPVVELFADLETSIIQDMARRLAKMDYETPTYLWQQKKFRELGYLQKEIDELIYKVMHKSDKLIKDIFTEACEYSVDIDNHTYLKAWEQGLTLAYPLDLKESPKLVQLLDAGVKSTQYELSNFSRTTAIVASQQFSDYIDLAWLQVSSGAFTRDQAVKEAVGKIARGGLKVIEYPSGRNDQVDVAIRRAVIGGLNKTDGKIIESRIIEMGTELVRTSSHMGSRPEHAEWQGKVFAYNKPVKGYSDFVTSTGYGTITGLKGANCRHSFAPFYEGISTITDPKYDEAESDRLYELEQEQRRLERQIRKWKRETDALEAGGQDAEMARRKVKEWQGRIRSFVKENDLKRQSVRERV